MVLSFSCAVAPFSVMRRTSPCLTCVCAKAVIAAAAITSASLLKRGQSFEHFLGMSSWFHLGENLSDLAIFSDHERRALHAHVLLAVHALFFPDTVGFGHRLLHIAEQRQL